MVDKLYFLRKIHGNIHEFALKQKQKMYKRELISSGLRKSNTVENKSYTDDYPVDFVVLWVDGNDSEWLHERQKYINNDGEKQKNNTEARSRNWDNFQYWFRAVEKYAPWVRYVYFVTWGHIPSWMNTSHPKLKIIKHEEFIPQQYLPTFCTGPLELNFWRINGISEHVVYFNDDMFLMKPVEKSDFFQNGLPKYCAIAKPIFPYDHMTAWEHMQFNAAGVINSKFNVTEVITNHPEKWFSYKYGELVKFNIRAYEDNNISGMLFSHLGAPCRVSVMKEVWEQIGDQLHETCMRKFRTMDDLIFQLFELWEICKGTFEPVEPSYYGYAGNIIPDNYERFKELILCDKIRMICINDSEQLKSEDFEEIKNKILEIFNIKFPEKSAYEL